jgi:hypothetical protein
MFVLSPCLEPGVLKTLSYLFFQKTLGGANIKQEIEGQRLG